MSEISPDPPRLRTVNPATEAEIAVYEPHTLEEVGYAIAAAERAQRAWRTIAVHERAEILRRVGTALRAGRERYAQLICTEMGKPVLQARAEIEKCAATCDHVADEGPAALAQRPVATEADRSYVGYEPLGVVLGVMPWNFPFFQVFRFAAPALLAGNAVLLKHAPATSGCALAIEQVLADAGVPADVFAALLVAEAAVAHVTAGIIADRRVAAVSFTGSEAAGRAIGAVAGRALKKAILELGGSDPFLVLDDADVPAAAHLAARSRLFNGGQSCIAAKRFIVAAPVADAFVEHLGAALERTVVGDPLDETTELGPLARADLLETLDERVRASVAAGATLRFGGRRLDRPGFYYAPTLLTDVAPDMDAFREETFGPVAAVAVARDDHHAIELANATRFGLGASIWTSDPERGHRVGARVASGACFVNAITRSDPRLPFGGVKSSGYGRELGLEGMRELTNVRAVWIEEAPDGEP